MAHGAPGEPGADVTYGAYVPRLRYMALEAQRDALLEEFRWMTINAALDPNHPNTVAELQDKLLNIWQRSRAAIEAAS